MSWRVMYLQPSARGPPVPSLLPGAESLCLGESPPEEPPMRWLPFHLEASFSRSKAVPHLEQWPTSARSGVQRAHLLQVRYFLILADMVQHDNRGE